MPRFGLRVPQGWILDLVDIRDPVEQYEAMTQVAISAEQLGFDSVWLFDHFHTFHQPVLETTFECWTTTAALARDTSTIRIGQMVTCNGYRNPSLLAKMASTVDVLSHGRLDFGIGAGWWEDEYRAYGFPFATTAERLEMLGEALQVIKGMWTEPFASFDGTHYRIARAINEPKGVQKPHPPIWIGGWGDRVLRLAAEFGDATNFGGHLDDLAWYQRMFDALSRHCDAVGRPPDELVHSTDVETTLLSPGDDEVAWTARYRRGQTLQQYRTHAVVGGAQEVIDTYARLIEAGVDYIIVCDIPGLVHLDVLHRLAEDVLSVFRQPTASDADR